MVGILANLRRGLDRATIRAVAGEEDTTNPAPERPSGSSESVDAPSFKGRPTIDVWALESMRRSIQTLSGAEGSYRRRIVIALSYFAMFFLGMFAHQSLCSEPRIETRLGVLAIHSAPSGATVALNGMALEGDTPGTKATTPIPAVTNLKYGTDYLIRLEKSGYRPWEKTVRMGPEVDGRRIEAELEPE